MLNKQKGNMYGFVTHTWNTVKGECFHNCLYCYMKKWGKQRPVRFDEKELKTDLGENNFIFVGSSCDMFAQEIPDIWIEKSINYCNLFHNRYLFQTKNPNKFLSFNFPVDTILCTTLETNRFHVFSEAPELTTRIESFRVLLESDYQLMITIEPIMDFDLIEFLNIIHKIHPVQVNIGADSGNNSLPEPSTYKIKLLIERIKDMGITVFEKDNLKRLMS